MSRVRETEQQKAGHQLPQGGGRVKSESKNKSGSAHASSHKKRK